MEGRKKVKYIQKELAFPKVQQKKEQVVQQANKQEEAKKELAVKEQIKPAKQAKKEIAKTTVINVKVEFLRKNGYQNLLEWRNNENHVYIGRQNAYVKGADRSIWANPFKVQQNGRDGCIQKYKEYLLSNDKLLNQLKDLKGKVLGCWCAPQNCHGNVLAELADQQP